jgi:manganese/zinc/iron transport system ATP- binding protein
MRKVEGGIGMDIGMERSEGIGENNATSARGPHYPLILEDVTLSYGDKPIISDVNLKVREGMILGVLGPNGMGKTTLLRGILGILKPSRGRIRWISRGNSHRVRIGYAPQKERLDPAYPITIMEVIQMGTYCQGPWSPLLRSAQRKVAKEALEKVGMAHLSHMLFSACSGGQRQRVLVARALATQPEVLILDEPTTGIDLGTQNAIISLLRDLNQRDNMTILLVTQHFGPLSELFEEVAWVQNGRVLQGPAREFLCEEYIARAFGKF